MKKSLDRLTLIEKMLLKNYLWEVLDFKVVFNIFQKDSCTLSELVCGLFSRCNFSDHIENSIARGQFLIDSCKLTEELFPSSPTKIQFVCNLIDRIIKIYDQAVEACHGEKLPASPETIITLQRSFTRYRVIPKDFLQWSYDKRIIKKSLMNRLLMKNENPENLLPTLIDLLIELSNRPEYCTWTAMKIIKEDDEARKMLDNYFKTFKGNRKNKEKKIALEVRNLPAFGGKQNKRAKKP